MPSVFKGSTTSNPSSATITRALDELTLEEKQELESALKNEEKNNVPGDHEFKKPSEKFIDFATNAGSIIQATFGDDGKMESLTFPTKSFGASKRKPEHYKLLQKITKLDRPIFLSMQNLICDELQIPRQPFLEDLYAPDVVTDGATEGDKTIQRGAKIFTAIPVGKCVTLTKNAFMFTDGENVYKQFRAAPKLHEEIIQLGSS